MEELFLSKPPSSERLLWSKFLGATAALMALILTTSIAALVTEAVLFRGEVAVLPTLVGGLRSVLPVLFMAGLSFALGMFFRTAMIAGLLVTLPIGVQAGKEYLIPLLQFLLTPYHLAYALLGLALMAAVAGWWEARREPERRLRSSWIAAAALLAISAFSGALSAHRWRGWTLDEDPALARLADWRGKAPLPEMPLRTVRGDTLRLSAWRGKPIVLVFWSTDAEDSAVEVAALERAWRIAAPDRIGFASVCVTDDPIQARDLAAAAGLRGPVIWNPPPRFDQAVGLAAVFDLSAVPRAAVAGLIQRDGSVQKPAQPVSQPPQRLPGRPPHHDWERRLSELGVTAFRQLAEESP
jgi:hypothetical protein